jgi:hypothetical protein
MTGEASQGATAMITNIYPTKSQSSHDRVGQLHTGGEQNRRKMRAALHELRQRLGEDHKSASGARVVVTAGPAPSTECQMRGKLFQKLHGFYTIFTSCALF